MGFTRVVRRAGVAGGEAGQDHDGNHAGQGGRVVGRDAV